MQKAFTHFFALILFVLAVGVTSAHAQERKRPTKSVEVQGKDVVKSRGANPRIKSDMPTVDKPEAKSRGSVCGIYFNNYTGLTIKLYVDGNYEGTVSPYGESAVVVGSGYTTIYCVSAGGTREWSASGNCSDVYEYKLR